MALPAGAAEGRDVVVAASSVAAAASQQFPDRAVYGLERDSELSALLGRARAATVTFAGRWDDLRVHVSRLLAEWAAEDERRGCGIVLIDDETASKPRAAGQVTEEVGILVSGGASGVVDRTSFRPLDEVAAAELAFSGVPPLAISVTGHGAEHCIRLGGSWMATDPRLPPGGPVVPPASVRSPAVFLNCCASLRLGDSAIPRACSVSAALHRGGAAVVGSFRNIHTSPDAGLIFAEALLRGLPMGRVANAINRNAALWHETRPAFQLLGDPCRVVSARPGRCPAFVIGPRTPHLKPLARRVAQLDRLYETLSRWRRFPDHVHTAHERFLADARMLLVAQRAAEISRIGPDDWEVLEQTISKAVEGLRALIMEETVAYVTDRWLDTLYSPVCHRVHAAKSKCPRCGELMTRERYDSHRAGLLGVDHDECDRCGTLADRIGRGEGAAVLDAEVRPAELLARVRPLAPGAVGRVFVRHAKGSAPRAWPAGGGTVAFPLAEIERRGRSTVAAVTIEYGSLAVHYKTVFLPFP